MEYEKVEVEVSKILSQKRFNHSLGVAKKAEELAIKYGENAKIARLIGIAHDIAKEMSDEENLNYIKDNNIKINEVEKFNPKLLHGKIGADVCKKKFGFNEQMQNAIKYHTTGNINMDEMAKIIYLADKIEDGREYKDLEVAREKVNTSLDAGMLYMISREIRRCIDKNRLIHMDSVELFNKLSLN